jgi:hypothetical protein
MRLYKVHISYYVNGVQQWHLAEFPSHSPNLIQLFQKIEYEARY